MKKAFDKIENYNYYAWISVLIVLVTSISYGVINKYTEVITLLGRDGVYNTIEKYIGKHFLIELISRYIGVGITLLLIVYIILLMWYIFILFGVPNLVYYISSILFRKNITKSKGVTRWLICLASFIPGILCTADMLTLFNMLMSMDIVILHIIFLGIIQCILIILYIIEAIKSFLYKEDKTNG